LFFTTIGLRPTITVKQILLGVQELLTTPNNSDPAQTEAFQMLRNNKVAYEKKVKEQTEKYKA